MLCLYCCSVASLCLTLCNSMDCSTPDFPVLHDLLEFGQTHVCWVDDAIQPSHLLSPAPFSSCLQHFPVPRSFPMSRLFASGSQSTRASASAIVLPVSIQSWFPLGLTGLISLLSKRLLSLLSLHNSKASVFQHSALYMIQLSHLYTTNGKTIALTRWTFVSKVISLLFNTLSRFIIAFLSKSKHLHFMAAVTVCSDFGAQENKISHCFHSPRPPLSICHEVMGLDAMIFIFWMLFFASFSLFSFTLLKRLFISSSLSAIRVVSSACLKLLLFLSAILVPACDSSSPEFCMIYSAYKLNKQGDSMQAWHTPFPILNQSIVPCPILTVAFWPTYRFLRRQVRWSGIPISLRIFQFVVIHTVRGFCVVNEPEIDVFLEFSCFLYDQMNVGNLISGSFAFFKPSLNIWKVSVHVLLKTCLENFEHYLASMWILWHWNENLWDWNENWPFLVLWPLLNFPNWLAFCVQHFNSIIFKDLK